MLLAIDIGNSNVVVGIFFEGSWRHIWRMETFFEESPHLYYELRLRDHLLEANVKLDLLDKVVISSVVPELTTVFEELSVASFYTNPLIVGPAIYPFIKLRINNPYEVGADLVANSLAAFNIYGKDCIICDFGTALTFTTLTAQGEMLGVSIAPGIKTAIAALYHQTAQLPPEVPLQIPASVIGKDTVHANQSGVLIGYIGLVSHMITMIRQEAGEHFVTIATGGLSSILTDLQNNFDHVNPLLTLEGLRIAGEVVPG